jgi:hypothetical protein
MAWDYRKLGCAERKTGPLKNIKMQAKSIKGKSIPELKAALGKTINTDFQPTLAIVFSSVSQDLKGICDAIDAEGMAIFGCTTAGEFIDEQTETGSWVLLLMDLNPEYFQIYLEEYPHKNYREAAHNMAKKVRADFETPAILLGVSHVETNGEEILHGFQEILGPEVKLFGGLAGDDYVLKETHVFTNGNISNCGVVCLALDESKVEVQGMATCGWKAIGTEKTVTKSEGNHIYTIEDLPVVDITAKYGGLENVSPDNERLFVEFTCNLPLQMQREKGDPVMRSGLVIDWTDRSIYTNGSVPEGSKVRFSLPPDWDVMEKVVKGVEQLKNDRMPEADALVIFSCAGRIISLGPLMSEELEGVKNVWKVPMAGMFSYGELGRATGGNLEMHNLTTCCVALKEKNQGK